jgi:hypothetical protein
LLGKSGIKYAGALALVALLGLPSAEAGLKQLEIKGNVSFAGHAIDFGKTTDSGVMLDADLDFKMKFSQDVSARIDLEMDDAVAGDDLWGGKGPATAAAATITPNRYSIGVDQAYFKLNDFLFRNFNLTVGKQNMNVSLRDNKNMSWAFGDSIAVVGTYATRDMDIKGYYLKLTEDSLSSTGSNDGDETVIGAYVEYWLNDDSLVAGYVNYKSAQDDDLTTPTNYFDNLVHYGIGLDYFIGESLEVYGEVAGQSISDDSSPTATTLDGSAFQLTLGGEYAFTDYDMKPVVGLEYYLQSGTDAGGDPSWQNVAGGLASSDTNAIFMEANGKVGRDLNAGVGYVTLGGPHATSGINGYSVIRLNGAISPTKATKVGLGLHFFTNEDSGGFNNDDSIGTELDLYASWKYSQDVTFKGGFYLVSDPNVDSVAVDEDDITGVVISSALTF